MSEYEKDKEIIIPQNVLESKRIFGFRRRNVVEGILFALITAFIILNIPFVLRIKIIFLVTICFSVFVLSCIGIKDKSITEIFINIRYNLTLPKTLHLRSIDHASKRKKRKLSQENINTNQSAAEKTYAFLKEKYKLFKGESD